MANSRLFHKPIGPLEVWLSQPNMEVTCRVFHEDETIDELGVDSLSLRGAMREITGCLIGQGYKPEGRWEQQVIGEAMRRFKPVSVETEADREQAVQPAGREVTGQETLRCVRCGRAGASQESEEPIEWGTLDPDGHRVVCPQCITPDEQHAIDEDMFAVAETIRKRGLLG